MAHRILTVEDQGDIRKIIRMTLEFGNYEVHEAHDGETGLNMARAIKPHVILLDVMMPGLLDGFQVCKRIKSDPALRHIRVLLLTARGREADLATSAAVGADGHLIKPFNPLDLIDRVDGMVKSGPAFAN